LGTYQPAAAWLVRRPNGTPLPQKIRIWPEPGSHGFLVSPPALITTIKAASELLGDGCIDAVGVRVTGVNVAGEATQRKVEDVARSIHLKTGLDVDVTLGSSPMHQVIYLPGMDDVPPVGFVDQPWVKQGVHINIVKELDRGNLAEPAGRGLELFPVVWCLLTLGSDGWDVSFPNSPEEGKVPTLGRLALFSSPTLTGRGSCYIMAMVRQGRRLSCP